MDDIDASIIRNLQRDGRLSNLDLSDKVGLSPSPCLRRLRTLESNGTITGYAAQVDEAKYGLPVTVFIHIRLQVHTQEAVEAFEAAVMTMDNVLECHLLSGQTDYLLRALVRDLDDYNAFLREKIHAIPGIGSIDSTFAVHAIKQTHVFPARAKAKR